jgi:hypothetical protein
MLRGIFWDAQKSKTLDRITEDDFSIEKTLVRRGFTFKSNKTGLSKELLIELYHSREERVNKFYNLMNKESNRAILKKICLMNSGFTKEDLVKNWDSQRVEDLLEELKELVIVNQKSDGTFELVNSEVEYGSNLEWYIAEIFRREFFCTSDWGVHVVEAPSGGDYDVLARSENNLIYVECKAKSPSSIKEEELINFLKRDEFLRPYISIFFIDTTDSIYSLEELLNKIGLKIKELIKQHNIDFVMGSPPYTEKLNNLFFHFQSRLFFVNSHHPIIETFKLCFRHRYRIGEMDQAYKGRFWLHELLIEVEKWWQNEGTK